MSKIELTPEQKEALMRALPQGAVNPHPSKPNMSAIKPWAIYERMNEVFGVGGWSTTKELITCEQITQNTKNGPRQIWEATAKVTLHIGGWQEEYFGGSTNDDRGDAMKGATTDALTTLCAMHLGIGVYVWKNQAPPAPVTPPVTKKPAKPTVDIDEARALALLKQRGVPQIKGNKAGWEMDAQWEVFDLSLCVETKPTDYA